MASKTTNDFLTMATSKDRTRPILGCICEHGPYRVSTDTHRLHLTGTEPLTPEALAEADMDGVTVEYTKAQPHAEPADENASYPNWRRVLPREPGTTQVKLNREQVTRLVRCLKALKQVVAKTGHRVTLTFTPKNGGTLTVQGWLDPFQSEITLTATLGCRVERLEDQPDPGPKNAHTPSFTIAVDVRYLLDWLDAPMPKRGDHTVTVHLRTPTVPIYLLHDPIDDDQGLKRNYAALIMPMRP